MKWLKLFESFRDDFYISVNDLEEEYKSKRKKLFSDAKAKVDEFMFDLTDDFSGETNDRQNTIEGEDLSVWYYLKCDREDFERFIEMLSDVKDRLKDELGLDIRLKVDAWVKADTNFGPGNISHSFNHGYLSRWDEMMRYLGEYSKVKPVNRLVNRLDQYSHFTFAIQIS